MASTQEREENKMERERTETSMCSDLPRAGTFPSVNMEQHLKSKHAILPTPDPLNGQSLVDSQGNMKHISPHGVELDQYYLAMSEKEEAETNKDTDNQPDLIGNMPKQNSLDSIVLGTESTSLNMGSRQLTVSEDVMIELPAKANIKEAFPEEDSQQQQDETNKQEAEGGVFSTAVDEEMLSAAKDRLQERRRTYIESQRPTSSRSLPSMNDIINEKTDEHVAAANKHVSEGNYAQAIQHFNKALHLQPKDVQLYADRGEAFFNLCDFQSAILNYKKACVLCPENFDYYKRLAFFYYFQGQSLFDLKLYPEALEAFSRAAEMRPDVVGYHTRSIACLAALGRHGECLALINKRLETENDNTDLYVMRARLHQLFGNTTLCYYDVKDSLSLDPDHEEATRMMDALTSRADELQQQASQIQLLGRYRDALQKISLAIETNPSVADYHVLRGSLHRRLGDFNAAIDDYLLALDKTDHNEESVPYQNAQRQLLLTYNDFAVECFTKGFYEEAIILLNKAIKGEKREKGLYINRGDCFFREGSIQFAMADYYQALELDSNDQAIQSRIAVIHNEYGVEEYLAKNYKEAECRLTSAIKHNPRMGKYYLSRCRARQLQENLSGARDDVLMAIHLDPGNQEVVSLLPRLFPGKSVRDVLQSRAALQARANLSSTVCPIKLQPIANISNSTEENAKTELAAVERQGETLPPVAGSLWKPGGCFPDLKSCMLEREFHIKIATEKKEVNGRVKDALYNRKPLKYHGTRVQPLPPPAPPQLGKNGAKASNWKNLNIGLGVGLKASTS